jgi:glutathione peroxidase-family protein
VIMGFPTREFGAQEYKTDAEVADFAKSKTFPGIMMKLGKIKGDDAPEVWKFFEQETGVPNPTWNFKGKFLVSKSGKVSATSPDAVEDDITALMEE